MTESDEDVEAALAAVQPAQRQADARRLVQLMAEAAGEPARRWSGNIIGFGQYQYRYDSGREGEAPLIGFSPRAAALTLYLKLGAGDHAPLLAALGKHKTGKGCLYLKRLADVDESVLAALLAAAVRANRERHEAGRRSPVVQAEGASA